MAGFDAALAEEGKGEVFRVVCEKLDKRGNLIDTNTDKAKFFIRADTLFLEWANARIRDETVRSRTELIEDAYRY